MKLYLDLKKLWTVSMYTYIICSTAFSYGELKFLNSVALYFFFGVSLVNILCAKSVRLDIAAGTLIVYTGYSLIGMLYSPTSFNQANEVMYNYITMVILSICIVQYINTIRDVKMIVHAFMVAGAVLSVYVYSLYGSEFWTIMMEATDSTLGTVDRVGDALTNVNTISLCAAISMVIAVYYLIFDRKSKLNTLLCLLLAVFCFIVSMAAASKKSLLLIILCFIGMWLYTVIGTRNGLKQLRNAVVLIGSLVVLMYIINNVPIFVGISKRFGDLMFFVDRSQGTASEVNRLNFMTEGLKVWLNHILFGAGTASSIHYFGVYSHSNLVEILMNSGIIGFFIFYGVYIFSVHRYIRDAVAYKKVDKIAILLFAVLLSITVCGIAFVYYYDRYYMILLTVVFSAIRVFSSDKSLDKIILS